MRALWGPLPWYLRQPNGPTCWGANGNAFFDNAAAGTTCSRNWYQGSPGQLGLWGPIDDDGPVRFTTNAPALLGFDDAIDFYIDNNNGGNENHARKSVTHNVNILQLFPPATYNICVNYQWLLCAARGLLHGQGNTAMRFAYPPGRLVVIGGDRESIVAALHSLPAATRAALPPLPNSGWEAHLPFGTMSSYTACTAGQSGCYASGDIFYLEVCLLNAICENGAELFSLAIGQEWHCQLSEERLARLKATMIG